MISRPSEIVTCVEQILEKEASAVQKIKQGSALCLVLLIPALRIQRQEDCKFKATLDCNSKFIPS